MAKFGPKTIKQLLQTTILSGDAKLEIRTIVQFLKSATVGASMSVDDDDSNTFVSLIRDESNEVYIITVALSQGGLHHQLEIKIGEDDSCKELNEENLIPLFYKGNWVEKVKYHSTIGVIYFKKD